MTRQWNPDCKGPCDCPGEEVEGPVQLELDLCPQAPYAEPILLLAPEPNDGPGPDGHHVVSGECFACLVGVETGPESHGVRCPLARVQG